jgi:uncharacterized protein with FMN-binding domain
VRRRTAAATALTATAALVTAWRVGGPGSPPGAVPGVHVLAAPPSSSASRAAGSSSQRTKSGSRASSRSTPAAVRRTVTGAVVSTPYGNVQVAAVVKGTHLLDVQALHLTDANGTSRSISAGAEPQLRQEALQAQSAHIDTVSGATYTSEGYRQSLQAALDAAHP